MASTLYRMLFRLVLVRLDAERAHHLAVLVIRVAGLPGVRGILRRALADRGPRVHALGLSFAGPVGVAAGFDKDARLVAGLGALGFGHVEVGTITARPQPGNPRPRLARLPADRALVNRMGFNNRGAAAAARRLRRLRRLPGRPVIGVNIGKSRAVDVEDAVADYVTSATLLAPVADYLVVNVSSPNTPGLRGLQEARRLEPLLAAVRDAGGATPLLVKIAPDLDDDAVRDVARLASRLGLAGVVATNTTVAREGLRSRDDAVRQAGAGGLSGAPLRPRALAVLRLLAAEAPGLVLVSVGGVETASDVRERLAAGATLVQAYTGFVYAGPLFSCTLTGMAIPVSAGATSRKPTDS